MTLYVESSVVLAWLLGEPSWAHVRPAVLGATAVVSSAVTVLECERSLVRAAVTGRVPDGKAARRAVALHTAAKHWALHAVTDAILVGARRRFPREPVRTLDAIHLATMIALRDAVPDLTVASFDDGLRDNAMLLGFDVLP